MSLSNLNETPSLSTTISVPLHTLEEKILTQQVAIESWFRKQWLLTPPPVYSSVDLRNSGFKLAPVDTNLFPAGFNNLNHDLLPLCIQAMQATIESVAPGCLRILIIPESHTRNMFYFESLLTLQEILTKAGYDIAFGSLSPTIENNSIMLSSGKNISIQPIIKDKNRLKTADFNPCLILLNNDLSDGIPKIFENIEQKIIPSPKLGWSTRLKSNHFFHYQQICEEFSTILDIDPWLINPIFTKCEEVDFQNNEGVECLERNAQFVYEQLLDKYKEYKIPHDPYIVIKADAGTYGLGVLMIDHPKKIKQLNRRERAKMSKTKGNQPIRKVIIQEGVYTFESVGKNHAVAEPVIYMIGKHVVGGFYRVHTQKGTNENLNAPGMHFEPLAFSSACNNPDFDDKPDCQVNRFYAYGVVARLAALASAREAK